MEKHYVNTAAVLCTDLTELAERLCASDPTAVQFVTEACKQIRAMAEHAQQYHDALRKIDTSISIPWPSSTASERLAAVKTFVAEVLDEVAP